MYLYSQKNDREKRYLATQHSNVDKVLVYDLAIRPNIKPNIF